MSLFAACSLVAGCAPGAMTTQSSRIGYDDGTDSCRPQLVALDFTGNFFGPQILTGAAVGAAGGALIGGLASGNWRGALIGAGAGGLTGAAVGYWAALQQQQQDQAALYAHVSGDLTRENAQIDKTQLAFDQLTDCRYRQAAAINAAYAAHQINRGRAEADMAVVRQRAQRDVALAQQINQQIDGRAQQFDVAAGNLAPGTTSAVQASRPPAGLAVAQRGAKLKLRPDPSSPDLGDLKPREPVTIDGTRAGYALVQTSSGTRGYAPIEALQTPASSRRRAAPVTASQTADTNQSGGDVRSLVGSNAARRDDFAQSVSVASQATSSGFEVAG